MDSSRHNLYTEWDGVKPLGEDFVERLFPMTGQEDETRTCP